METIKIFLSGGIKHEEDSGETWRDKASQMLNTAIADKDIKIKIINPNDYYGYADQNDQTHIQSKRYYLDQILNARLVLVNLTRSDRSCGTAMETQYAFDHNIPVIGFGVEDIYPWISIDCQATFSSMLQAIDHIVEKYLS